MDLVMNLCYDGFGYECHYEIVELVIFCMMCDAFVIVCI
jgi:hypothetical protein